MIDYLFIFADIKMNFGYAYKNAYFMILCQLSYMLL